MQVGFGTGILTLVPSGTNVTPIQVGVLQDVSFNADIASKMLYGSYQFPVDISRGEGKLTGKCKFAQLNGALIAAVLTGATVTTGQTAGIANEIGTVPAVSTYTVTVANAATWVTDLGVIDTTTGLQMTRVASAPITGQYSVAAGVYTFAAADASKVVWISYDYTIAATGKTVSFTNQLMGSGTTYQIRQYNITKAKALGAIVWAAQFPKLDFAFKNNDYTMQDLEFMAFADSTGRVITMSTVE